MNFLTVGLLKKYLNFFNDEAFVCIVSSSDDSSHCVIEDCCDACPANDDLTGIYLYTESAKELCDEE